MATIKEIRAKYPQYNDMTDRELAEKLHAKFYSDLPFEEFASKIDLKEPSYAETAMGAVADLPTTVSNIPESAVNLVGGIYEAVTNPIETVSTLADVGAGGIRNAAILAERNGALPQGSVDFLDSLGDPAAAAAASEKAAAFGGVIADRWGSAEKIRRTLREDPVGFLGDLSTILTGAGVGVRAAGVAPRVAGAVERVATAVDPLTMAGRGASAAGGAVNRMVPKQTGQVTQTAKNMLPKVVQQLETTGRRVLAGAKNRALADITEGEDVNALIQALEQPSQFPRTAAEAAAPTKAAPYVALQTRLAERGKTGGFKQAEKTKAAIETPVANIKGTPAQRDAAVKQRQAMAGPFYEAADKAFIREDGALRELLGRPDVAAAARRAADKARNERRAAKIGETRAPAQEWGLVREENGRPVFGYTQVPGETAEYSGKFVSDIIEELKSEYKTRRTMPTADASSNRILKDTIDDMENWFQGRSPERKTAKQLYEMYSGPVNRRDIGKLIYDGLSPTTKRGTTDLDFNAFAKLLEDEPATVAKALDWSSTTKKFRDAGLTDADIKAIKAIDAERVNKNLSSDLEKFGRERASEVVSDVYETVGSPNFLNRFWTVFNMVKRIVGAKLSDSAVAEMTLEALDPKLAAKALREMQKKLKPAPVRQMPGMPPVPQKVQGAAKVARAVKAGVKELPRPSARGLTATGTVANTMAQAREDYPNAFLTDARGQSYDVQGNRMAR